MIQRVCRPPRLRQHVLPDFFSRDFHKNASMCLDGADGITLSNFLPGRVFHRMIQDLFKEELPNRSDALVGEVRRYVEEVFTVLCETACASFPRTLRMKIKEMIGIFLGEVEAHCKRIVSNLCRAELAWTFTQNASYDVTRTAVLERVRRAVEYEAKGGPNSKLPSPLWGQDVHGVPMLFIAQMVDLTNAEDGSRTQDVFHLQVLSCHFITGDHTDEIDAACFCVRNSR